MLLLPLTDSNNIQSPHSIMFLMVSMHLTAVGMIQNSWAVNCSYLWPDLESFSRMLYIQIPYLVASKVGTCSKMWSHCNWLWIGPKSCGIIKPPNVISVSYGFNKAHFLPLIYRGNVWNMLKWDILIKILFSFTFCSLEWWGHLWSTVVEILVLQTLVSHRQISAWIALVCPGSPWSTCFILTLVYEDQIDPKGNIFNPRFPVCPVLPFFVSNNAFIYFSLPVRM